MRLVPPQINTINIVIHIISYSNSLRAQFSEDESTHNPLHASVTEEEAEKEIQYFFPKEKTLAVIKPNAINERGRYIHGHLIPSNTSFLMSLSLFSS